jgi:serine acetyltransferase
MGRLTWLSYLILVLTSRGLQVLILHRFRAWVSQHCEDKGRITACVLRLLRHASYYFMAVMAKSDIRSDTTIDAGVYLSNGGNVVIGATRIGRGCAIQRNVTIGMNNMSAGNERPTIGDNVWIGANSIIFGGISIGNGTTLQEGTVLTRSVPPNCLVKGNPALIVKRGANNEVLLARPEALSTSFAGL